MFRRIEPLVPVSPTADDGSAAESDPATPAAAGVAALPSASVPEGEARAASDPVVAADAPATAPASGAGDVVAEPVVEPPPPARPALAAEKPLSAPPAAASGGVGDLLLSARADSGFSIEEASARTRIPRDVIEHLECNACGLLPPEYYCNAHIEKLSALYNVDPRPILDRFHADMLAHRGAAEGLGHFHAVTTDSESGSKISYVLPGPGAGKPPRAVSLTGAVVSLVLALLLLIVVAALAAQHFRPRNSAAPTNTVLPQVGHAAPVDLKEFIVTEELNAYELPIPAK